MYYPAFINVENRTCLVIGGGKFAEEKVFKLLSHGAKIKIVSPDITENIKIFWIKKKLFGLRENILQEI